MTGMLASVSSVNEAESVFNANVNIIDIKNPREGALGALDLDVVKQIVSRVNNQFPVSATIGDVNSNDKCLTTYIQKMADAGVDYVKVGLFNSTPCRQFIKAINDAANNNIDIVAVIFAEDYINVETYMPLFNSGIVGIMVDTRIKSGKNLRQIMDDIQLEQFISITKEYNLLSGLAGSLQFSDINPLLLLKPDYLGFRGALCSNNNRVNHIDAFKLKQIRNAIPQVKKINYDLDKDEQEVMKNGAVA